MIANYYIPTKSTGLGAHIWEQRTDQPLRWQILPSGAVELIFRLGPAAEELKAASLNTEINPTRHFCFLSGLHTRPLYLSIPRFHFMGIQMSPIAIKALFGLPCLELKDWALDGAFLFRGLNQIEDKLLAPGSFHQKATWLEGFLYKRITETAELHSAFKIKKVVEAFAVNPENRNRTLLDLTGYSRSHTHRLFTDWFGLAPTHHLQLTQFINALQGLHDPTKRLTQIAYEHGYYDQAHFIRAFKQFTNMTPKQYRKNMTGIVGQLDWR